MFQINLKRITNKISLDSLEKSAIRYLEKYSASKNQLKTILKRKIIKTSFFYKTKPNKELEFIELIINKFEKIGLINDKSFSENKILNYIEKGYSKKKIIFNLKIKGISDKDIENGFDNLKKSFYNYELTSALIYAKKKKLLDFNKKKENFARIQKKLSKISQAGFSYEIAKKIINLNNEEEYLQLKEYARNGLN